MQQIEVDPAREPICVSGRVYNELCAHAREAYPEECCGLVVGDAAERFRDVVRCRNEMTLRREQGRTNRDGYWMNAADYHCAWLDAQKQGLDVTGVYHSHVNLDAYLSAMDVEYATPGVFPRADQIVIAVSQGKVRRIGVFTRDREAGPFDGRLLEPAAP